MSTLAWVHHRKAVGLCLLGLLLALSGAYCIQFWARNARLFLALYQPEQLFRAGGQSEEGTHILRSLNEEIEQDNRIAPAQDLWVLAKLDNLWESFRRYVSPRAQRRPAPGIPPSRTSRTKEAIARRSTAPEGTEPATGRAYTRVDTEELLHHVVALALEPARPESIPGTRRHPAPRLPAIPDAPPRGEPAPEKRLDKGGEDAPAPPSEIFYRRLESLEGLRTRTLIWQLNRNLALEGTVESSPVGDTDPDLTDFGFRTVHALAFLRDCRMPSTLAGRERVDSGYPLSYGLGLNYRVSPSMSIRFDYAHESPNDSVIEYRGSWERSLVARYDKHSPENVPSIHNFFLGLRYMYRKQSVGVPLQTGFFYATNMADDPLSSNVSLGFTIGGGINRKDFRVGFAYRFRVWDNPEDARLVEEDTLRELGTRLSNQFLLTVVF